MRKALEAGDALPKYQYGTGCLADQLLGQYLAHVTGLGYVLDSSHVKRAMHSIFKNNFKPSMVSWANVQRTYAVNDEAGLVLCTWPRGDRPSLPFPYCDEVWTGFEYQVAASLIYNDLVDEGLKVVKAARDRYNGLHRNPWDEEECGHHYARAMSSWALLLALSGFHYDGVTGVMAFAPAEKKGRLQQLLVMRYGMGNDDARSDSWEAHDHSSHFAWPSLPELTCLAGDQRSIEAINRHDRRKARQGSSRSGETCNDQIQ